MQKGMPRPFVCEVCGTEGVARSSIKRFCDPCAKVRNTASSVAAHAATRELNRKGRPDTRTFTCEGCGSQGETSLKGSGRRRFCTDCQAGRQKLYEARSRERARAKLAPPVTPCALCGINVRQVEGRGNRVRYCRPCAVRAIADRQLRSTHNITLAQYESVLASQGGKCANVGCDQTSPGGVPGGRWLVDHDHACCPQSGKSCGQCFRGLLCMGCNTAAGMLRDSPDRIRGLARYIEASRSPVRLAG
jgi:hypothetical protein